MKLELRISDTSIPVRKRYIEVFNDGKFIGVSSFRTVTADEKTLASSVQSFLEKLVTQLNQG